MTAVDTTVWIDFFAGRDTPEVAALERLIESREDICLCGIILTEVLQGIRDDREYRRTETLLSGLLFLPNWLGIGAALDHSQSPRRSCDLLWVALSMSRTSTCLSYWASS